MAPSQGKPSPGDMTGRQKERLGKDVLAEQRDRSAEVSMASRVEQQLQEEAVFDPQSGERVDDGVVVVGFPDVSEQEHRDTSSVPPGFARYQEQQVSDGEPVFTGQEPPEVVEAEVLRRREMVRRPPGSVVTPLSPEVIIRVDADIEDMTYGVIDNLPNNFTFKEGHKYRVPRELAEHLDDRGLVRQWL